MLKKIIIIGIIILAGIIASLILLKSGGGILSSSGSPEAVVKAFFEAVDNGNISKAKDYISLEIDLEDLGYLGDEELLPWLKGAIKKVEIENEQKEKAFGIEQTILIVKATLKPSVQEEAKNRLEEEEKKHVLKRDASVIVGNRFIAEFPEKQKFFLEKYQNGWKIFDIEYISKIKWVK
ncbi:hypothetical protein J7J95_03055 [bacterium]|nr:hypothetical protein [bacterium]